MISREAMRGQREGERMHVCEIWTAKDLDWTDGRGTILQKEAHSLAH